MRRFAAALAAAWLLGPALVASQEQVLRLTVDEAIERALAQSPHVAELEARQDAAEAAEQGTVAAGRPLLALQGGYTRTNHVDEFLIAQPGQPARVLYPDVPDNYRARLDLQWPIYTAGRVDALQRAARAERQAAGEDLAAARADLRLEATRAVWAAVTAREAEQVLARAVESVAAHLEELRHRLDQGLIPPNDVLSARARLSRQRVLAIEGTNLRRVADADLRRLLGVEDAIPIEVVVADIASGPAGPLEAVDGLVRRAIGHRPERRGLESRSLAARARLEAMAADSRPQVAVGGGYDVARPNPRIFPRRDDWEPTWDLSVSVTWSLWDGGRRRAGQAEAAAVERAARTRVDEFDRQVAFEVRQRRLELDSSLAAIDAAADGVEAAAESRRVVQERFRAGVISSTDVLDAELALVQSELDRTRAVAAARLAEARLARAVGAWP